MIQKHFRLLLLSVLMALSPLGWGQPVTQYGPIKSGDLIWDIALKVRVDDSVSRFQMMQALLAKNPQAFIVSCNVNSPLKIGEVLTVPTLSEVQQFSKGDARRQFAAQAEAWQQARKQKLDIDCPDVATARINDNSVTQTPLIPMPTLAPIPPQSSATSTPITTMPPPTAQALTAETVDNKAYPQPLSPFILPPTHNAGADSTSASTVMNSTAAEAGEPAIESPPIVSNTPKSGLSELVNPSALLELQRALAGLPLWILIGFGVLLALIVLLLIGLLLALRRAKSTKDTMHALSPVAAPPQNTPKMSTAVWGELPAKKNADTARSQSNSANLPAYELIERQLANIRTCLAAEGETQAVRILLREVMEHGTQHQQAQAQQLLEIGRKMHWLEERQGRSGEKPDTASTAPLSERADSGNTESYLPQRYLPEEQERVFELVDKIFKMLDQELQADGQLVEAYMNRHQREQFWDSRHYKVIDKVQTPFPESPSPNTTQSREAKPAPRYL